MNAPDHAGDLRDEVRAAEWYHTLELAPGVVTPGWFDTRLVAAKIPMPVTLAGRRCLDVGTFDGFWAFEMERRGAAEVIAIDVPDPLEWDWPASPDAAVVDAIGSRRRRGDGFDLARRALGSQVERRELSVYDLDPEKIGRFDFIYLGSLVVHLRDPVRALSRIRSVCSGDLLVVENHEPLLSALAPRVPLARLDGRGRPWWWEANVACLKRMLEAAGFATAGKTTRFGMPAGAGQAVPPLRLGTLRTREGRRALRDARRGDPHVAIAARPRAA